ncbi:MBL fold metallo-hydrolase, partial [Mesorhizobium sp. M2A.F.Ca.ET.017.03.2.1]
LREHLFASHSLAEDAGRIASDAGVRRLVLNHLIPADDPAIGEADWVAAVRKTWPGDLTIARDGLVVQLSGAKAARGEETA